MLVYNRLYVNLSLILHRPFPVLNPLFFQAQYMEFMHPFMVDFRSLWVTAAAK